MSTTTQQKTKSTTRQEAFKAAYQQALDAYVEKYLTLEDPDDPFKLFWTRHFDYERMEEMQLPAGSNWEKEIVGIRRCEPEYRELYQWIDTVNRQARDIMQAHFKKAGYDYNFPPAPDMDHETAQKIKPFYVQHVSSRAYGDSDVVHKNALRIGQLIVLSSTWRGEKRYTILVESSGLSFPWEPATEGNKEQKALFHARVIALVSEWSKLTDWSLFSGEMLNKQRRALGEKAKEIYAKHIEGKA